MKADFFKRLGAYLIDAIIISIVLSFVNTSILKTTEEKLNNSIEELSEKLENNEITSEEYLNITMKETYDIQKSNVVYNTITFIITFVYYVVFQFLNKGQTIGKKILKIKVVDKNKKLPTLFQFLLRGIIIYNITSGLVNILLFFELKQSIYMPIYLTITSLESILFIVSACFVLYRNDKLGLHDLICHTMVINEKDN